MGRSNASFYGSLFSLSIDYDSHTAERHAIYIGQGGLGLPDREAYLDTGSATLRAAYQAYVARLLELEGWTAAAPAAASVLAFETRAAEASWSAQDQREETRTYNPASPEELEQEAPSFPWAAYPASAGLHPQRVVLAERSAVIALARLNAETPLDTLKAWAAFHLADNAALDLSHVYAAAWFDLHGRRLQGATAPPVRWRQAL